MSIEGVVEFDDESREVVTRLKYQSEKRLARTMANMMMPTIGLGQLPDVLTWIPTSHEHLSARGFDHAELIARHLGALSGVRCVQLLRRTSKGHQTGRTRFQRLEGVSFVGHPRCVGSHVMVIDDVCTTGSTLRAASVALSRCGAASIRCVAFSFVA